MARVRDYKLELAWLLVLILTLALVPRSAAEADVWSFDDTAPSRCGDGTGECIVICCN